MEQTLPYNRTKKLEFSDLPFEIRLKIWREMLPRRQLNIREGRMEISARRQVERGVPVFVGNRFGSPGAALPVGLHINYESRQETLKHYTVLHRPVVHNGKILSSYKGLFLINTDLDTVFVTQPALMCCDVQFIKKWVKGTFEYYGEETKKVRDAIKKIEIYILTAKREFFYKNENIGELMRFKGLEELVLVRHPNAVEEGESTDEYCCDMYRTACEIAKSKNEKKLRDRVIPKITVRLDTCVEEFKQDVVGQEAT